MGRLLLLVVLAAGPTLASGRPSAPATVNTSSPGVEARWEAAPLDAVLFDLATRAGLEVLLTDSVRGLVHLEARGAAPRALFDQLVAAHGLRVVDLEGVRLVRGPGPARTGPTPVLVTGHPLTAAAPMRLALAAIDVRRLVALIAEEHGTTIVCDPRIRARLWIRAIDRRPLTLLSWIAAAVEVPLVVTPGVMRLGPAAPFSDGR